MGTHTGHDGRVYSDRGIEPGTIYVIVDYGTGEKTGQYGVTPDGEGMVWYDSENELFADRLDFLEPAPRVELTEDDLERLRVNESHTGHRTDTAWWCDTCDSPYCENA